MIGALVWRLVTAHDVGPWWLLAAAFTVVSVGLDQLVRLRCQRELVAPDTPAVLVRAFRRSVRRRYARLVWPTGAVTAVAVLPRLASLSGRAAAGVGAVVAVRSALRAWRDPYRPVLVGVCWTAGMERLQRRWSRTARAVPALVAAAGVAAVVGGGSVTVTVTVAVGTGLVAAVGAGWPVGRARYAVLQRMHRALAGLFSDVETQPWEVDRRVAGVAPVRVRWQRGQAVPVEVAAPLPAAWSVGSEQALVDDLQRRLEVWAPRWRVQIDAARRTVTATRGRELPASVTFDPAEVAPSRLPIGIAADHRDVQVPLAVDLREVPHALACGRTGTGKSSLIRTMLVGHLLGGGIAVFIDMKQVEGRLVESLHGVAGVATTVPEALALLRGAVLEMDATNSEIVQAGTLHIDELSEPPVRLLVIVDECADLLLKVGGRSGPAAAENAMRAEIELLLLRLAQKGRNVGVSLLVATQRPSAELISSALREQMGAAVALGRQDEVMHRMAGIRHAPTFEPAKGRGIYRSDVQEPVVVQVALVLPRQLDALRASALPSPGLDERAWFDRLHRMRRADRPTAEPPAAPAEVTPPGRGAAGSEREPASVAPPPVTVLPRGPLPTRPPVAPDVGSTCGPGEVPSGAVGPQPPVPWWAVDDDDRRTRAG